MNDSNDPLALATVHWGEKLENKFIGLCRACLFDFDAVAFRLNEHLSVLRNEQVKNDFFMSQEMKSHMKIVPKKNQSVLIGQTVTPTLCRLHWTEFHKQEAKFQIKNACDEELENQFKAKEQEFAAQFNLDTQPNEEQEAFNILQSESIHSIMSTVDVDDIRTSDDIALPTCEGEAPEEPEEEVVPVPIYSMSKNVNGMLASPELMSTVAVSYRGQETDEQAAEDTRHTTSTTHADEDEGGTGRAGPEHAEDSSDDEDLWQEMRGRSSKPRVDRAERLAVSQSVRLEEKGLIRHAVPSSLWADLRDQAVSTPSQYLTVCVDPGAARVSISDAAQHILRAEQKLSGVTLTSLRSTQSVAPVCDEVKRQADSWDLLPRAEDIIHPQCVPFNPHYSLILGSSSRFRKQVVELLGWPFTTLSPDIDEKAVRHPDPMKLPLVVARAKMKALRERIGEECKQATLLICSDQITLFEGEVREKPESEEEARAFLKSYSNKSLTAVSAVVITDLSTGKTVEGVDTAEVHWKTIPDDVIERVVASRSTMQCAGGYRIYDEHLRGLISNITGTDTVSCIFGLPVTLTTRLLRQIHDPLLVDSASGCTAQLHISAPRPHKQHAASCSVKDTIWARSPSLLATFAVQQETSSAQVLRHISEGLPDAIVLPVRETVYNGQTYPAALGPCGQHSWKANASLPRGKTARTVVMRCDGPEGSVAVSFLGNHGTVLRLDLVHKSSARGRDSRMLVAQVMTDAGRPKWWPRAQKEFGMHLVTEDATLQNIVQRIGY